MPNVSRGETYWFLDEAGALSPTRPTPDATVDAVSLRMSRDRNTSTVFDDPNSETTIGRMFHLEGNICDSREHASLLGMHHVGIELEMEGFERSPSRMTGWRIEQDRSLRNNGFEFKSTGPMRGVKLYNAIERLTKYLESVEHTSSERCSTHIHLDVRDMTPVQLNNLLILSAMLEHVMFKLFGNTRTANTFCMSIDTGTTNFDNFVKMVAAPELEHFNITFSKYAAIGLYRLRDLGTVEYRMFSAIESKEDYLRLINLLYAMKDFAMEVSGPQGVVDRKLTTGAQAMCQGFFPEVVNHYDGDFERLLERGIRTANDILMCAEVFNYVNEQKKQYEDVIRAARTQLSRVSRGY